MNNLYDEQNYENSFFILYNLSFKCNILYYAEQVYGLCVSVPSLFYRVIII